MDESDEVIVELVLGIVFALGMVAVVSWLLSVGG